MAFLLQIMIVRKSNPHKRNRCIAQWNVLNQNNKIVFLRVYKANLFYSDYYNST